MADSSQVLAAIVGFLAGIPALYLLYTIAVRPRVYLESRDLDTVRVFREKHRAEIEQALKGMGVPTAYLEVGWWNRGHRAAHQITVEVSSPCPILLWEVIPDSTDVAAGWICELDPTAGEGDPHRLRLSQNRLMPGGLCHLVVGYNHENDQGAPTVRGYSQDRRIRSGYGLRDSLDSLGGVVAVIVSASTYLTLDRAVWMDRLSQRSAFVAGLAAIGLSVLAGVATFWLLWRLYPGKPPWAQKKK